MGASVWFCGLQWSVDAIIVFFCDDSVLHNVVGKINGVVVSSAGFILYFSFLFVLVTFRRCSCCSLGLFCAGWLCLEGFLFWLVSSKR